jgi:two-component system, OmpR family, sensor kinase
MGHCQQALGLDRLPLTNGSPPVTVFQTGRPYLTGRTDQDREQPRGVIDGLGVCSQAAVVLVVHGERRGLLEVGRETEREFVQYARALHIALSEAPGGYRS